MVFLALWMLHVQAATPVHLACFPFGVFQKGNTHVVLWPSCILLSVDYHDTANVHQIV